MPIYEYQCTHCGKITEEIQKFSDPPLTSCESCSGPIKKLVSRTSFQLKGTGWYATDYKKTPTTSTEASPAAAASSSPETKKDSGGSGAASGSGS